MIRALKDRSDTSSDPLVSVVITTYNSEKWLPTALDSVLEQQTKFPVEIVISDDFSRDETLSVAKLYQNRYPSIMRIIARAENVGTQRNYYGAFEESRGRYIAWLDADDYWTDPTKLSLQVSALEVDPTIMICGHYVRWVTRGSNGQVLRERFPSIPSGLHGMQSILKSNFLPSPSVLFRNGLHRKMPDWYFQVSPLTDWPLYVVGAREGQILLLDRVMADYTLNENSAFWGEGTLFWHNSNADFYERVEEIVPFEFRNLVRAEKGRRYEEVSYILRKRGDYAGSRKAAWQAFRSPSAMDNLVSKIKTILASMIREAQHRLRKTRSQLLACFFQF